MYKRLEVVVSTNGIHERLDRLIQYFKEEESKSLLEVDVENVMEDFVKFVLLTHPLSLELKEV